MTIVYKHALVLSNMPFRKHLMGLVNKIKNETPNVNQSYQSYQPQGSLQPPPNAQQYGTTAVPGVHPYPNAPGSAYGSPQYGGQQQQQQPGSLGYLPPYGSQQQQPPPGYTIPLDSGQNYGANQTSNQTSQTAFSGTVPPTTQKHHGYDQGRSNQNFRTNGEAIGAQNPQISGQPPAYGVHPQHGNAQHGQVQHQGGYVQNLGAMSGYHGGLTNQTHQQQQVYNAGNNGNNEGMIRSILQRVIAANGLQTFYDQNRFEEVVRRVLAIDFNYISQQWRISKELSYDLAPLALYDIIFYCDDSGSMIFEENGDRIEDLKFILDKVAPIATMFDSDGILVRFMNNNREGNGIKNSFDVQALLSSVTFSGTTPLGTNLDKKVIQPFVVGQANSQRMMKPVLVIAITDGEPSEQRDTLAKVVNSAKIALSRTRYGPGAFALEIAQVGKDARAQKFLASLDTDPTVGKMIDCTSGYELEQEEYSRKGVNLTPELWVLKMCVGAIDPTYGDADD